MLVSLIWTITLTSNVRYVNGSFVIAELVVVVLIAVIQNNRPPKRTLDAGDSARFSSIFLASSFFCPQALSTPALTSARENCLAQSCVFESKGASVMKKSIKSVVFVLIFLTVLLSSCAPAPTPIPPTFTPSPIPPTITPSPTFTPEPTFTATPLTSIDVPTQIAPLDGSTFNDYPRKATLEWTNVANAASYVVEFDCFHCCAKDQWCTDVGQEYGTIRNIATNNLTQDGFAGAQPFRWRVWAVGSNGLESAKSPWWVLTFTQ
jgi:hypothetical protein